MENFTTAWYIKCYFNVKFSYELHSLVARFRHSQLILSPLKELSHTFRNPSVRNNLRLNGFFPGIDCRRGTGRDVFPIIHVLISRGLR